MNDRAYPLMAFVIVLILSALACLACAADIPRLTGPFGLTPGPKETELGRALFFDPRLSQNGTVSCSTCHNPQFGWSDGQPQAVGILGQVGTRNSPTIINASYSPHQFWDGRVIATESQALLPLSNPIEMGQQSEADVVGRLRLIPGYVSLFAQVYGVDVTSGSPITGVNLARAIASFETSITSFRAPIDAYLDGNVNALTPDERVGFGIFQRSGCMNCHPAPHYTTHLFANSGSEFATTFQVRDQGRAGVAGIPDNASTIRAFKVPTLRSIGRSAPFMHNGQMPDLARVVRHYSTGASNYRGQRDRFLDPRIKPLNLTLEQEGYLVRFLSRAFEGADYPMVDSPRLPE